MSRWAQFLDRLQSYGSRTCLEDANAVYSYAQLLERMTLWQSRCGENVLRGSVVGLRADYSIDAVAALLAMLARGACVAMIPRDRDWAHYMRDAHAAVSLEVETNGEYRWHHIAAPPRHPLVDRLRAADESGLIIFTSGSTGRPKAALQALERFLHKYRNPGRCLRTIAFLLFDHVAGLDTLFYTLSSGGTLILTRRRDPLSIMQLIESHAVEVLPASPSFLRLLCATPAGAHDLSSLKIITYGSEPMDAATLARLNRRFGNVQIAQKYGTTETGSPRTMSRGNDSLWVKFKEGVETKVVDDMLWIRSEGTILGYLNAESPVDDDGWYCTGDLVDVDGEWLRFRGRATDIIKVGGEKVAPAEVEQTILELDIVREAVVSGEPHPLMGQVVTARIALSVPLDAKEAAKIVRAHCRSRLPSFKVPLRVDVATDGFATERQKAQRRRDAAG